MYLKKIIATTPQFTQHFEQAQDEERERKKKQHCGIQFEFLLGWNFK